MFVCAGLYVPVPMYVRKYVYLLCTGMYVAVCMYFTA